jgi:hypothetical protein
VRIRIRSLFFGRATPSSLIPVIAPFAKDAHENRIETPVENSDEGMTEADSQPKGPREQPKRQQPIDP